MSAWSFAILQPQGNLMSAPCTCLAVVTGIGWVGPFGLGGQDLLATTLRANTTAIAPIQRFATHIPAHHLGAEVAPATLVETDETRRWSRMSQMTVAACRQALAEAGLDSPASRQAGGLIVGSEYGDLYSTEMFSLGFLRKGPLGLSPLLFPSTVMNAMAGTASIALGITGPMLTLNHMGVAGELAVARAVTMLQSGRASVMLACGVDELFSTLYETLGVLQMLSPNDGGTEACAPFDQRHNGIIPGEGASAIVLELPDQAQARGVPILAAVHGVQWGGTPVRPHRYPRPQQLSATCLNQTLAQAAVSQAAIDLAYLSGSGTPQHDMAELAALTATFGGQSPAVTSVTHLTGEYGGLGTLRVAAAVLGISRGIVPVLDYLQHPVRSDIRFVTQAVTRPPRLALVHALGRGGMQVALILGQPCTGKGTNHGA